MITWITRKVLGMLSTETVELEAKRRRMAVCPKGWAIVDEEHLEAMEQSLKLMRRANAMLGTFGTERVIRWKRGEVA